VNTEEGRNGQVEAEKLLRRKSDAQGTGSILRVLLQLDHRAITMFIVDMHEEVLQIFQINECVLSPGIMCIEFRLCFWNLTRPRLD
jgi:hypothetical protein